MNPFLAVPLIRGYTNLMPFLRIIAFLGAIASVSTASGNGLLPQEELIAPSPNGPIGLFHTMSAERQPAGPLAFGQSVTGTYFNLGDFPVGGQETERLAGRAALSFTPHRYTEFFLSGSALTSNDKNAAQLIQQVGNLDFGAKLGFGPMEVWSVAAAFQGHFRRAVGDVSRNDSAMSYDVLTVGTLNFLPWRVPVRIHMNAGFRWDGTGDLLDATTATERQRIILEAPGKDAVLWALGVEIPVAPLVMSVEYSTEQTVNTPLAEYADNPQRFTVGLRYFPTQDRALTVGLAANLGMFATDGSTRIIREPDFSFLLGMTYLFGTAGTQRVIKSAMPASAAATGRIIGKVADTRTGQPIGHVRVELCDTGTSPVVTSETDGTFRSYPLPDGDCLIRVSREGYEPEARKVVVEAQKISEQNFSLSPAEPKRGVLVVQVKAADGYPVKGKVTLPEVPQAQPMETNDAGSLRMRLPTGTYRVLVSGALGGSAETSAEVLEGRETYAEVSIGKSAKPLARLGKDSIEVSQQIQFASGKDVLLEESKKTIAEVAAILKSHPEISKIEVGGHTDSSGNAVTNRNLSLRRAKAVVAELISLGVEAERLDPKGYGSEKPIASNSSKTGRFTNRRVEFSIVKSPNP